ncbi:hypothetical protein [Aestuariivirga sp.]|uniref:hypothetical protein n=1 Tax=Aestuariivirga sp. TaxID=2650926 RepID=UPI0025BF8D88|nr:hypothetical protein [Aestuariivirga sp.]MCA3555886.1 hypothetical protein [Aestuariivirga sp.]
MHATRHDGRTALQRAASLMRLPGLPAGFGAEPEAALAHWFGKPLIGLRRDDGPWG